MSNQPKEDDQARKDTKKHISTQKKYELQKVDAEVFNKDDRPDNEIRQAQLNEYQDKLVRITTQLQEDKPSTQILIRDLRVFLDKNLFFVEYGEDIRSIILQIQNTFVSNIDNIIYFKGFVQVLRDCLITKQPKLYSVVMIQIFDQFIDLQTRIPYDVTFKQLPADLKSSNKLECKILNSIFLAGQLIVQSFYDKFFPMQFTDSVCKLLQTAAFFKRNEGIWFVNLVNKFVYQNKYSDEMTGRECELILSEARNQAIYYLLCIENYDLVYDQLYKNSDILQTNIVTYQYYQGDELKDQLSQHIQNCCKYFRTVKNYFLLAVSLTNYIRIQSYYHVDPSELRVYAVEAIMLFYLLPYQLQEDYYSRIEGQRIQYRLCELSSDNVMLNDNVRFMVMEDLLTSYIPFFDSLNETKLASGTRGQMIAYIKTFCADIIKPEIFDLLKTFLCIPQYPISYDKYFEDGYNLLNTLCKAENGRDVMGFADLAVVRIMENSIILYINNNVTQGKDFTLLQFSQDIEVLLKRFIPYEVHLIFSEKILFDMVLELISNKIVCNFKLNLISKTFVVQRTDVYGLSLQKHQLNQFLFKDLQLERKSENTVNTDLYNSGAFYDILNEQLQQLSVIQSKKLSSQLQQQQTIELKRMKIKTELKEQGDAERKRLDEQFRAQEEKAKQQQDEVNERIRQLRAQESVEEDIQRYIRDNAVLFDDSELQQFLENLDFSRIPLKNRKAYLVKSHNDFTDERNSRRHQELAARTRRNEAFLFKGRALKIEDLKQQRDHEQNELNQLMQTLCQSRFDYETQRFKKAQTYKQFNKAFESSVTQFQDVIKQFDTDMFDKAQKLYVDKKTMQKEKIQKDYDDYLIKQKEIQERIDKERREENEKLLQNAEATKLKAKEAALNKPKQGMVTLDVKSTSQTPNNPFARNVFMPGGSQAKPVSIGQQPKQSVQQSQYSKQPGPQTNPFGSNTSGIGNRFTKPTSQQPIFFNSAMKPEDKK